MKIKYALGYDMLPVVGKLKMKKNLEKGNYDASRTVTEKKG
jgi:hypothetical protein